MSNSPNTQNRKPKKKPSYSFLYLGMFAIIGFILVGQFFGDISSIEITRLDFDKLFLKRHISKVETINDQKALVYIYKDTLSLPEYKSYKIPMSLAKEESPIFTFKISDAGALEDHVKELVKTHGVAEIPVIPSYESNSFFTWMINLLPVLILVGFWYFMLRSPGSGEGGGFPGGQIFSIGKSKAQLFDENATGQITFAQVAGLDEEKVEVEEIVSFLKDPQKYTNLGGKIPKGALLIGPPGTGKTLLAKAMAGEAKVPFFSMSGSDFVEMFVGVGASRVRDLFKQARDKSPCIVFIDEIDAIGRSRNKSVVGGNDEREATLNQLLVEMDGFGSDKAVIILAATNRPDILDDALLRPGRFDRQIHINRPDMKGREQIFKVHVKPIKTEDNIDVKRLAELTPGFVGADIANICNEAALVAARKNKSAVTMEDFNDAIDRVTSGLEKKNKLISKEEKKSIAYHEAGHALVSWHLEYAHPFVRVTIIPRSESLGHALYLPKEKYLTIKEELEDRICVSLGGRAAEDLAFGQISTGALSDLDHVTQLAYSMVTVYGMSEKVGNVSFYRMSQNSYDKPYSDQTSELIDKEVRAIIDIQYERAKKLLNERRDQLDLLANSLLEREVLVKSDLEVLFGKRIWDKDEEIQDDSQSNVAEDTIETDQTLNIIENINTDTKSEG
ncbi:MAG: ATP-dependent zinc metalloprotease FtsH [Chitinophagales bacterium]|jgi:cell division protease FtsH|nr:ATP-dependent zinc metalloprotease FtsH [Chitinophagales bacterium]